MSSERDRGARGRRGEPGEPAVLLVTPPVLPCNELPELGVPRLVAFLRSHGVHCEQRDLSIELLHDFLAQGPRFLDVVESASNAVGLGSDAARTWRGLGRAPRAASEGIEMVRRWIEQCVGTHELEGPRDLDGVLAAARRGHALYESFFAERLFDDGSRGQPPGVLGLSIMSVSQVLPAVLLAAMAKERWPATCVVIGGPWVTAAGEAGVRIGPKPGASDGTVLDELLAAFEAIDAAVLGQGEGPLLEITRRLACSRPIDQVAGVLVRGGSGRAVGASLPLDRLPPPVFDGPDLDLYPVRMLPLQTTSRCPWGKCVFCYHDHGSAGLSRREPSDVARAMLDLRERHGVESFFFADCGTELELMRRTAHALGDVGGHLRWSTMCRAEPGFDDATCRLLRSSGCRVLMVGLETVSTTGLEMLRKGISKDRVERLVRSCGEAGIGVYLFLLDYPGNTVDALRATLDFVLELSPWIEDFMISRFQLSTLSRVFAEPWLLDVTPEAPDGVWLDVFDIPFDRSSMIPAGDFERLSSVARREFDLRPERGRSPFVVASSRDQRSPSNRRPTGAGRPAR